MNHMHDINSSTSRTTMELPTNFESIHSQYHSLTHKENSATRANSFKYFRPWESQKNGASSTLTQSLVDQVSVEVENNSSNLANNNNSSIPSTTSIPSSSMVAIQQSMTNALPLILPTTKSHYGETITIDGIPLYSQPLYVNTAEDILSYPTNYSPANSYGFNMLHHQQQGTHFIPAPPVYPPHYATSPTNLVAGHYYSPNIISHWSNVLYSNNMTAEYVKKPAEHPVYSTAMQHNMDAGIKQMSLSAPLPTSAHYVAYIPSKAGLTRPQSLSPNRVSKNGNTSRNSQTTQQNMLKPTPVLEVEVPPTSTQTANKRENANPNITSQTNQIAKPLVPSKASAVPPASTKPNVNYTLPELTKSVLQEETSSNCRITKRKCADNVQEEKAIAPPKKVKMMSKATKLIDILTYHPNMARYRPKKEESKEAQLAREQNTIACRKYRRLRKIAKIIEQELIEVGSASEFTKLLEI